MSEAPNSPGSAAPAGQVVGIWSQEPTAPRPGRSPADPDVVVERSEAEADAFRVAVHEIFADSELVPELVLDPVLRKRPTTEKGWTTVNLMLDAALNVVIREGIREVSTRAVAREVGVNIATLYQYFEDIDSLLLAVALRDQSFRTVALAERTIELGETGDMREWLETTVEMLAIDVIQSGHHRAVVTIMQSVPAVRAVSTMAWETGARYMATGFAYRYGGDAHSYWLPITRAVQSAVRLVIDDAAESSPEDVQRIREVTQMGWEYLLARIPEPAGT